MYYVKEVQQKGICNTKLKTLNFSFSVQLHGGIPLLQKRPEMDFPQIGQVREVQDFFARNEE